VNNRKHVQEVWKKTKRRQRNVDKGPPVLARAVAKFINLDERSLIRTIGKKKRKKGESLSRATRGEGKR